MCWLGDLCKNKFGSTSTYLYVLMITKRKRTIVCTDYFFKCAEAQRLEHNLNEEGKC